MGAHTNETLWSDTAVALDVTLHQFNGSSIEFRLKEERVFAARDRLEKHHYERGYLSTIHI